ncbi:MAG: phosphatidate cytidylyltransferase [SAR202 cluster bacterium]|nr:phosphatidate cytidylyltransferase [SAR202 cluster bacterium]
MTPATPAPSAPLPAPAKKGTLKPRLLTSAVGIPVLAVAVLAGGAWFAFLVALAACLGAFEAARMARNIGWRASDFISGLWAVALVWTAYLYASDYQGTVYGALLAALGATAAISLLRLMKGVNIGLRGVGATVGAVLYVGGTLAHAPLLRGLDQGMEWVFFLIAVTFATDTAAFFVGRAIGRHKMAPKISPGKTWEGTFGGFAGAVLAAVAAMYALDLQVPALSAVALGAVMGVWGQLGDLAESRLKRITGVKDSGRIMPGHGGVLDRLDSIVFNLVVVYYFVIWAP